MKNLLFAAMLLQAGNVYAQDGVKVSTAPEAGNKYAADIARTIRDLAALLERGAEIPAARLDALAPELKRFEDKVRDALGGDITAELARREQDQEDAARAAAAKQALRDLRAALQVYYGDHGGKYPADLAALAPGGLPAIPELYLPGHARTSAVKVIDSKAYDKDLAGAVTDAGGWLYFANPGSTSYGLLVINCRHAEAGGQEFYKY